MLVNNFKDTCFEYTNFQIWDVPDMDAFMGGNSILAEIFKNDYGMTYPEAKKKRSEIEDTDFQIMHNVLDQIGDKHFYLFTWHDDNHSELVQMQNLKIMNFGIDINEIDEDHVYVVIMDKKTGAGF